MNIYVYGLIGYICIFSYNLYKLANLNQNIYNIIGFILIIIPSGLISVYYSRIITSSLNEMNNKSQLLTRLLFHIVFIIYNLYSIVILNSEYYYNYIGLIAHMTLLYNVLSKTDYLFGRIMLLIYFIYGAIVSLKNIKPVLLQFIGQVILILFFSKIIFKQLTIKKIKK
jgi:hypothetical protein